MLQCVHHLAQSVRSTGCCWQDDRGCSGLFRAVYNNQVDIVRILLAKGADLNIQNSDGETPVYAAAYTSTAEVLGVLLDAGADPNLPTLMGENVMHAVMNGCNSQSHQVRVREACIRAPA